MNKAKRIRKLLPLAVILVMALTPMTAFGGTTVTAMAAAPDTSWYNGGAGPFSIASANQLAGLAQLVNAGDDFSGKTVTLTADIDLSGYTAGAGWTPIGSVDIATVTLHPYGGIFDGGNHIIYNLSVNGTGEFCSGLFGFVDGGTVKNLGVAGGAVSGDGAGVGGVVGLNGLYYGGTVGGCSFTGTVTGSSNVGGVVGNNAGTVTGCRNAGAVTGANNVGGVIGASSGGAAVTGCENTGKVSGSGGSIGGVAGSNNDCAISGCMNSGAVGGGSGVGGVAGSSSGTVTGCQNTGAVTGGTGNGVGGVVGASNGIGATIGACSNTGPVSGAGSNIGGVAGSSNGNIASTAITNCYNTGAVAGTGAGSNYIGGVVGWSFSATVGACRNTGAVSGANEVGGVAGQNSDNGNTGTITNCYNTGAVTGAGYVGGVAGQNYGQIDSSYNTGAVSGAADYVGGVAGSNGHIVSTLSPAIITDCWNTGAVTGSGSSNVGGVAGRNETGCTVGACYNSGPVTGFTYVGGAVGYNYGSVSNCYNTGPVAIIDTANTVGGVVGYNGTAGAITNCYNAGPVTGSGGNAVGGVLGSNDGGTIANCFFDSTINSGLDGVGDPSDNSDAVPLATTDMTDAGTLVSPGAMADINGDSAFVKPDYSSGSNGCATAFYPELAVFAGSSDAFTQAMSKSSVATDGATCTLGPNEQYFTQGSGISGDPYLIYTAQQLNHVREHLNGTYFKLMADINLDGFDSIGDGHGWLPVGTYISGSPDAAFTGDFDGNGHIIQNITINRPGTNYVGLFGDVGAGGAVYGLGIVGGSVTGGDSVGGVAGVAGYESGAAGAVENCYNTAAIIGNGDFVGGVAGQVQPTGMVTGCYNTGSVSSTGSKVGGVAGAIDGPGAVTNCYSVGAVTGNSQVGGVIGNNGGTAANCYYDSDNYTGAGTGAGTDTTTGLSTARMVAAGTLSGDMSGLNAGSAFAKRPTDDAYCYYPELNGFFANPPVTAAQIASMASVQVARRTPAVAPSATAITYGQTLAASTLGGGATDPVSGNTVDGAFAWLDGALVPAVGTASYGYTFTPDFADLYLTVGGAASVTVNAAGASYVITSGANSSWKIGTSTSLTIVSNGDISKFIGIKIDGAMINAGNYTAVPASTKVTFKPEYLSTLAVGRHTVTFVYTDGSVSTGLTILAADSTPAPTPGPGAAQPAPSGGPQTGDAGNMILWVWIGCAALAAMGGLLAATLGKRRRLKIK